MPLIMAVIRVCTAAFSRLMATQLGRWCVQALAFFGISWFSGKIVSSQVTPRLAQAFGGMPGEALQWISFFNVDRALTIVISAYATVAATRWHFTRTAGVPKA